jgi:RimK family alpha-L-glutamate ligase
MKSKAFSSRKMKMTVLASGHGWHIQDLHRAAIEHDIQLHTALFQQLSLDMLVDCNSLQVIHANGHRLNDQDAILVRMMPPAGLEKVVFRMDMLHRLSESGMQIANPPKVIEMAVDKALSLARLSAAGINVPPTWVGESVEDAMIAFQKMSGDVICKPIFGSEGRGLIRITDYEQAWRVFQSLSQIDSVIYLQKFIKNNGSDIRVMVLGDEIIASMKRIAKEAEWRANVAQGARAEPIRNLPNEIKDIAIRTAKEVGSVILGIDFIYDLEGRIYLIEINGVPGWRAISDVCQIDIAAEWLLKMKSGICL